MPENIGYQFNRLYASPIETYRQVNTISQRNSIPPEIRWEGMECYVVSENQDYQLVGGVDNSNWVNAGETVSNPTTHFKGFFNATTVTPAISNLNGIEGDEYKVTNGGVNVDFGAGDVFLETDDIIIFYQSEWRVKVRPGTDAVVSVFGRTGAVVANSSDYAAFYSPIITGGASTIVTDNLTANRALLSNGSGKVAVSDITSTELGYLDNVTSNIQTQLNAKLATSSYTAADVLTKIKTVDGSGSGLDADLLDGLHSTDFIRNQSSSPQSASLWISGTSRFTTRIAINAGNQLFGDGTMFGGGSANDLGIRNDLGNIFFAAGGSTPNVVINTSGNVSIGNTNNTYKLDVSGTGRFTGTVIAAPAALSTELVTKGQLDAAARPYKVYTALLSQSGTGAPTAIVLENTLGGTVVWSRIGQGEYLATLSGAFTVNKTLCFFQKSTQTNSSSPFTYSFSAPVSGSNVVELETQLAGANADGLIERCSIEIRVYT